MLRNSFLLDAWQQNPHSFAYVMHSRSVRLPFTFSYSECAPLSREPEVSKTSLKLAFPCMLIRIITEFVVSLLYLHLCARTICSLPFAWPDSEESVIRPCPGGALIECHAPFPGIPRGSPTALLAISSFDYFRHIRYVFRLYAGSFRLQKPNFPANVTNSVILPNHSPRFRCFIRIGEFTRVADAREMGYFRVRAREMGAPNRMLSHRWLQVSVVSVEVASFLPIIQNSRTGTVSGHANMTGPGTL